MVFTQRYASPLGGEQKAADEQGLIGLWFDGARHFAANLPEAREEKRMPVLDEAARWLDDYFSGGQPDFTPPLHRLGVPAARVGAPARNPIRADDDIRRAAGRRRERAGCRRRGRAKPDFHHRAVPSGDRRRRKPDGLRRGRGQENPPAGAGATGNQKTIKKRQRPVLRRALLRFYGAFF